MKIVPNVATKLVREDGLLKGEWADRSLDDEDRYIREDTIFIRASVEEGDGDEKHLNSVMINSYDEWIKETRS